MFDSPLRRTTSEKNARVTSGRALNPTSSALGHLEDKFLSIALRIAAYPVALILVNGIITGASLLAACADDQSEICTYLCREASTQKQYTFCTACTTFCTVDGGSSSQCLRKGIRAAWRARHPQASSAKADFLNTKHSLAEMLDSAPHLTYQLGAADLGRAYELPRRDSTTFIDMSHALSRLPMDAPRDFQPKHKTLPRNEPASFTRSFSGVRSECLPEGLTDDVDC
ncbi:hypothetical protein EHS25_007624 [Saitozyma podzolica]|uniref:Uncharacterized protein n=1 Tax=Saitozyma podzolica TaxID=1890683 RepID=A0A427YQD4_9TREE|nr:hypothetical protein EHS25_007624 [Saitozyma podzolica]